MKLMFASDIHGSAYYCRELLEALDRENPDKLVLLGDLLYHGPRNDLPKEYEPKQVIAMLNKISDRIICVRGNCEAEVDQMVFDFPCMADYCVLYADSTVIYATHGHLYNQEHLLPMNKGEFLIHGHTHIPVCVKKNNITVLNPGSVSIPKENSWHGYMIFENGAFVWKDLQGNVMQVQTQDS